jgi:uncharacterized protein YdaU (DUF1376 family)
MRIPYFNFYPADFMHGVRGLTAQEVGVYTMILCRIYEESGPVEYHVRRLATYCGMREATFAAVVEKLIDLDKLQLVGGVLSNRRAEVEIQKRADGLKIASKAGKLSAEKRQQNQSIKPTTVQRKVNHTDTDTDTEEYISSNEEIVIRAVDDVSEAVTIYNDAAERSAWPSVQKMTPQRRKALRGRLSECGGLDGWKCAIGKAEASDFLCGRTAKPWTGFGFDWITKAANFTKLMEGNYDNRAKQDATSNPSGVHSDPTLRAILAAAGSFKA